MKRFSTPVALIMAASLMVHCPLLGFDDSAEDSTMEGVMLVVALGELEINGNYNDNFGGTHEVNARRDLTSGDPTGYWNSGTTERSVVEFSNDSRILYAVAGVPSWCTGQGTTYPNCECFTAETCFGRFVWTYYKENLYYCESVYNKPDLQTAKSESAPANPDQPDTDGCGTFNSSWTRMDRRE